MSTATSPPGYRLFDPADSHGLKIRRINVTEYRDLIGRGVIPTTGDLELLDGVVVLKDRRDAGNPDMAIGNRHNLCVYRLGMLSPRLAPLGMILITQGPLEVGGRSTPEPDGCILRGRDRDYFADAPTAASAECVFEVADPSLETDRNVKREIYATARIPHYVIINLQHNVLEHFVLKNGVYAAPTILSRNDTLHLTMSQGRVFHVSAAELLLLD